MKLFLSALSFLLSIVVLLSFVPFVALKTEAKTENESLAAMIDRAEAMVNYEWTPDTDIAVWNENPYNGDLFFRAGQTIKGIPYTLFSYELGFDSLLSLEQFKTKSNYTATHKCNAVGAVRTGPAYGSCCATFVSEIFGGSFMNGSNPKYDGVGTIQDSPYAITMENVPACNIEAGDALSSSDGGHIIWIGDVNDQYFTVYEQTPPVARKTLIPVSSIDSDGFLKINYWGKDLIFNVVTKNQDYLKLFEPNSRGSKGSTVTEEQVISKLNTLVQRYPNGSRWNSSFDGGIQLMVEFNVMVLVN